VGPVRGEESLAGVGRLARPPKSKSRKVRLTAGEYTVWRTAALPWVATVWSRVAVALAVAVGRYAFRFTS
jgi:hypothetical protein